MYLRLYLAAMLCSLLLMPASAQARSRGPFKESAYVCTGSSQPHYRPIYAHPSDVPSNYAQRAPKWLRSVQIAGGEINRQHRLKFPSEVVRLPIICGVDEVTLPTPAAQTTMQTITADLRAAGYGQLGQSQPERLIVLMDYRNSRSFSYAGETESFEPMNDQIASLSGVASVQYVYRDWQPITNRTTLHELLHSMGAVWDPAPGSVGGGHCMDGPDVLCESGPGKCAASTIDCGQDSYYRPHAPAWSYLARNWNLAGPENLWLRIGPRSVDDAVPAAPASVRVLQVLNYHQALLAVEGSDEQRFVTYDGWLRGLGQQVSPGVVLYERKDMTGTNLRQELSVRLQARSASGALSDPSPAVLIDFPADTEAPQVTLAQTPPQSKRPMITWSGSDDVAYFVVKVKSCSKHRCTWNEAGRYSGGVAETSYHLAAKAGAQLVAASVQAVDLGGLASQVQTIRLHMPAAPAQPSSKR